MKKTFKQWIIGIIVWLAIMTAILSLNAQPTTVYVTKYVITTEKERTKGETGQLVIAPYTQLILNVHGNYGEETADYGGYITISTVGRYNIIRMLYSGNPTETKCIIVKDREFVEVIFSLNTMRLYQLNNNPKNIWWTYYYQSTPMNEDEINTMEAKLQTK